MLQFYIFKIYCIKVEDAASLKDTKEEFKNLKQLNISLYDCEEDSSDEEEEQEDAAGVVGRASVEVASFFLQSALQLEVILIDWYSEFLVLVLICGMKRLSFVI